MDKKTIFFKKEKLLSELIENLLTLLKPEKKINLIN